MPQPSRARRTRRVSVLAAADPAARRLSAWLLALAVAVATVIAVPAAAGASTKTPLPRSKATSPTSAGQHPTHNVCAEAEKAGQASCMSVVRDDVIGPKGVQPADTPAGFGPADLLSAYNLPSGGAGQTVAIVDAFDDPTAESDLAVYRQQYGLPPCTTANGCFKKIDQRGGTSYPPPDSGWAGEISLDVDMVSAICPSCNILLVESDDNYMDNLGAAVNQAVAQGAKYVSNSYGGGEGSDETQYDDSFFHHPGVAITASTGDDGYGTSYPAVSPYVTAVGGTSLAKDTSTTRGWTEAAWSGAGSGCSTYETKPSFQTDSGCSRRAVADVSAVADPNTGVAVYYGGWHVYGGTSASAPIIASTYALGGTPAAGSSPNSFPYDQTSDLNDVTSGSNGSCDPAYLCKAGTGYDGPTGLGTPNGTGAFHSGPRGVVSGTVTDGTNALAEAKVSVGDTTTTTDGQGHYTLNVPAGTYDVTASKFGYTSKSVSGVAVADGQTVTENFALTAKAIVNVTGTVRDGSGHGWPLYATVRVKGEPTSAVYTDPRTGRFSISVPAGDTYSLQVDALYPGYSQGAADVTVGSADVNKDVDVAVDQTTCSAAGYTYHYAGSTQSFDGTTAPAGWTVDDKVGNGQTWVFTDPGNRTNHTGGSGGFANIDSDKYGNGGSQNTSLISPALDFSGQAHPYLSFRSDYYGISSSVGDVDYSVDGGQTWSNVWHHTNDSARGPRTESVDLSAAGNKSAVQVRFHYTGKFSWWWQVDDVFVGSRSCDPTSGGLVVGQVQDKNTGTGVNGASVTSADRPAEKATSAATPDDPNLGDGFYWLYSSVTGSHKITATASNYTSQDVTVNVAANWATEGNFSLAAPRITITPSSVSKTVAWQGQAGQTVTLKNTGTAPVTAKIGERTGTYQPAAQGAPLQKVKGDYSSGRFQPGKVDAKAKAKAAAASAAAPYAPPWTTTADYPSAVMDNGAATIDGKVYSVGGVDGLATSAKTYVYDPAAQAWSALASMSAGREAPEVAALNGKLYVFGGWSDSGDTVAKTEIYDPAANTWTTGADNPKPFAGAGVTVADGKIYVVGGCADACGQTGVQVYDPASNSWSSAHAYPESTAWLGCGGLGDKVYCAGGTAGTASSKHAYAYDASSDSWSSVADLPIDLWAMSSSTANGQLLVSGGVTNGTSTLTNQGFAYDPDANAWTALPNSNNTLYRGAAACGFYKIGGSTGGFNAVKNSEQLPGYDQCDAAGGDVPWLSEDKSEVTIKAGGTAKVVVSLNADVDTITQPGTFTAQVTIGAKTPYGALAVPVTLTVNPPKTWGKITGTVTGAGCTGAPAPLTGATVQIDSWTASYTLKTDKNGQYVLWLDTRNNPLTLIAAKDGWAPQTRSVKIAKLATTTADFALKPDHTCS
ncbi:carboxypeptidase regulatory-like domain-containing protein [Actinoallomurus iriomotensis]|uniref:carboxypeptidase regulatory-like domain-containing protein n=1 Tax=Actinoallomurus iriomotensis TaxID=478107 RepID=UPI0025528F56|nr:carboxypeptidase regulatory-like domain-containing protein [Actinoallomurus iriomotensis]